MKLTAQSVASSKASIWIGRVISSLVVLFLVFDGVTKLMKVQQVIDATVRIGFPVTTVVGIGITLLVCTLLYVIPYTSVLGAILLTAYLGGATAAQFRAGSPTFETLFPIISAGLPGSECFCGNRGFEHWFRYEAGEGDVIDESIRHMIRRRQTLTRNGFASA